MQPKHVRISKRAGTMTIEWPDGTRSEFTFEELRKACPCALCEEERKQNRPKLWIPEAFQLADAVLVGNYAINLIWVDGHNDGIYHWDYLRSLKTPEPTASQEAASEQS